MHRRPLTRPKAGDDAGAGRAAVFGVHAVRGPQTQLEELGAFVEQQLEALAYGKPALGVLRFSRLCAAALVNHLLLVAQLRQ